MRSHVRVARPTDDLAALVRFYCDGLGLARLAVFLDHAGFDGVMLGHAELPWHLEFTRERGVSAPRAPSAEHQLVFYLPERNEWERAVLRLDALGAPRVPAHNPYWDQRGVTFEDPDGYRVVLQNAAWPPT